MGAWWFALGASVMTVEFFLSKSMHYSQARGYSRVPADFPVQVITDELRVNDRAADISESGVGVVTRRPLPPMALVSVRMELPHSEAPIELLGRVMWANEKKMGIRFEQSSPQLGHVVTQLRRDFSRL